MSISKSMSKLRLTVLSFVLLLGFSTTANAAIITLTPSSSTLNVGDNVTIDFVISDLTSGGAPSLSAYFVDALFNNALFNFVSVFNYSTNLGLSLNSPVELIPPLVSPGIVGVLDSTFETPAFLDINQPASFTMFSITFQAMNMGTGGFTIDTLTSSFSNSDSSGLIDITALNTTSVSVTNATSTVSEPATGALILTLVAGLFATNRRRRVS
ncbi:PEP-CTERM sorting domain-containing protein [Alteromonas sp. MMG017]|uniref:PEP-CTERM sorting domain-containing protein n=1 Tax=Alteromonas sp. MMG017 TaxID=2822692 RepID=UPI001B3A24DA|nr:PEP-CTERM sorting domain-containing protein [Alteromonas sp. MMG017]MBQ4831345.1 PEP-CTERM sorting domain-containing protein [Alteromonas sp. MMG017]